MRRNYFVSNDTMKLAAVDILISVFSVSVALIIRSGFADFLVGTTAVAVLIPLLVFIRLVSMVLLEQYAYPIGVWKPSDITTLAVHVLPATVVLIFLRLLSPLPILRLPLSVIGVEYLISLSLMILYRAFQVQSGSRMSGYSIHRPRILLWGEVTTIRENGVIVNIQQEESFVIRGILSPNPLFWDTDLQGHRVFGNESSIPAVLGGDDSISIVVLIEPRSQTRGHLKTLFAIAESSCLQVLEYRNDCRPVPVRFTDYLTPVVPGSGHKNPPEIINSDPQVKKMDKDAKVFLAGHGGLVGGSVLKRLQDSGYTNIVTKTHPELDLTDQAAVERFFNVERPEIVILAAARVGGILANATYQAEFIYQNTMIATNVIHAAWDYGIRKLINLGSSCIYPKHATQPLSEDALLTGLLEPTNEPYAIAKITAIKLCRYYNEQYGTNFISAMPTNLYGPGDNFTLETSHVLPALIRRFTMARGAGIDGADLPVMLWGDGTPMREFLYVDDLAEALLFLMEHVDAPLMRSVSEDYFVNVGSGTDLSIRSLAGIVADVVGWSGEIEWDSTKPNGTPRKLMDVSKIHELGWSARTSLDEGIRKTYAWYREHHGL